MSTPSLYYLQNIETGKAKVRPVFDVWKDNCTALNLKAEIEVSKDGSVEYHLKIYPGKKHQQHYSIDSPVAGENTGVAIYYGYATDNSNDSVARFDILDGHCSYDWLIENQNLVWNKIHRFIVSLESIKQETKIVVSEAQ